MTRRLPLLVIGCVTLFVVIAEKLCGTDTYFAAAVGVIFVAIGVTYNLLGGLTTISGMLFTEFALRTIVISQFLKIFYREAADLNLESPHLTITLYTIFFCSLALASIFFGRLRLPLPRPVEPRTEAQSRALYLISLAGGVFSVLMYAVGQTSGVALTLSHSIGLVLSGLLMFALVLSIDSTIRLTAGRHSVGWGVVVPLAFLWFDALVFTTRETVAGSVFLYYFICYTRGYRFRRRHLYAGVGFALFFIFVFSPFELYSRAVLWGRDLNDRVAGTVELLEQPPKLRSFAAPTPQTGYEGRTGYLNATENNVMQRMALIWPDSALINACASGFHYGWTSIRMDLAYAVPRFINPNKPDSDSTLYVGLVSGLNTDPTSNQAIAYSAIGESFAAFGIPGVMVLGIFVVPLFFAIYRSVFDPRTVWGTVALALAIPAFGEWRTSAYLINTIEQPIYLIGLSWILNAIAHAIPTRRESPLPALQSPPVPAQPGSAG